MTRYGIDDLDRAIADSEARGFVKVLTVPGKDTILGVTIVGTHAADLLAEYVLAMKHGLGLNNILGTIHTYPTLSEANKYAAGEWKMFKADYTVIPWATFSDPEVARVGLNEQEAKEKAIAFEVTKYGIDDLDRALADSEARGFVKVLTVPGKDTILGVTIVGTHAADLLAEYVLAMKHGLGLNKILGTIHTYPTLSEANKYAAGEWKRAHQPHALLKWVARYHAWKRR